MIKKIVLDAGHALGLAGSFEVAGIDEWTLNHKVALAVQKQLADYEVEVHRVDDMTGQKDIALSERISRVNKIAPDVCVSIHHNACKGKWGTHSGIGVYYHSDRKNDIEKALANVISAGIAANTGLKNRGAKTAAYMMLTVNPKTIALLTKGGFMDSIFDHPVITSIKGQEGYAKAISDALIKQLKLKKKVKAVEKEITSRTTKTTYSLSTSISNIKAGDKYTLKNNTPGYDNAADAKAKESQRVNVAAGHYDVYHIDDGMLNITKSEGYPGLWINPEEADGAMPKEPFTAKQGLTIGGKYILKNHAPGYATSADAKAERNQRVTVLADEYIIYNIANGMINITKVKGYPGSWINPDQVE